jgi:hypothetical protein
VLGGGAEPALAIAAAGVAAAGLAALWAALTPSSA